jgi:hypothetical protein
MIRVKNSFSSILLSHRRPRIYRLGWSFAFSLTMRFACFSHTSSGWCCTKWTLNCSIPSTPGERLSSYIDLPKRLGCPASGRDRLHPLLWNAHRLIYVLQWWDEWQDLKWEFLNGLVLLDNRWSATFIPWTITGQDLFLVSALVAMALTHSFFFFISFLPAALSICTAKSPLLSYRTARTV